MENEVISLDILTERPVMRIDEMSEQDIVIQVSSKQVSDDKTMIRKSLNLCIVIDRSGSMEGEKLATAKKSCMDVFNRLRADDMFTVVVFDDNAEVVVNPQVPKGDVIKKIGTIESGGSTNLSKGWYLGLQELQTYKTENYINRLVLLSDGQANKGETKKNVLAKESSRARDLGITTSTIGIGSDFVEDILEAIASESGGRFWYIQDSKIEDIINEEFKGSIAVVKEKPRVELALPSGVKIAKQLNNVKIFSGKYRLRPITSDYLFNFAIRLEINPELIASGSITFKAALYDGDEFISETGKEILLRPFEEYVVSEENPLVKSVVEQYEMSSTDEMMIEKMDEGDMDAMESMMEKERMGMNRAKGLLEDDRWKGQEVDEFLRELNHVDKKLLENQNMLIIVDLLKRIKGLPIGGLLQLQVNDLILMLRKTLMYRMHGEKERRYSAENDRTIQFNLLNQALEIVDDLIGKFPGKSDLLEIKGKINGQLERYK